MKKLFALISLTAFLAVSVNAQSTQTADQKVSTETPATKDEVKSAKSGKACCTTANASCCKSKKGSKACTAEQKAACAKAGSSKASHGKSGCSHDHSKTEVEDITTKIATRMFVFISLNLFA